MPVARSTGGQHLERWRLNQWTLRNDLAAFHSAGAWNFKVTPRYYLIL